ncbi:precorrin-6y C5,15-methyltransferase (decarboxylating) subunit CbiE [Cereibacter changlensis]|uniref:precorrin-6y C5,15-methyltransferase (decarboxylating) subunit CbiE n=1 Tax=Cereibacter changlensis TaxID=402884 RepID=UPI004033EF41
MAEPWLSIIGLGEDGLSGLSAASRKALDEAELVFGGPRHLALAGGRGRDWPVPFSVAPVLACRGQRVAVLASGDPFWHGAGGSLAAHLAPGEWRAFPAPSTFSLAAARLGWRLEEVLCLGLHAAPLTRLRPLLGQGVRAICLLRDGAAPAELAAWLAAQGFGGSRLTVLECLGGPRERIRQAEAASFAITDSQAPVAVAIEAVGPGLPRASGLPDALFEHDGQITKRPVRALTLSALAPRPGELLWDIGTGSGSVSIEWLLAAPGSLAVGLEADADRAARARANAEGFGLGHRFTLHEARAPEGIDGLPRPDAVFIGGGASEPLLQALWDRMPAGCRLVANAVTLETEALLALWSERTGGSLLRIELAEAMPLGRKRGWRAALPVVQWSVVR